MDRKGGEIMKNTGKLTIIMVAVVAIGVFSLPSVLSVGTGQHNFNNGGAVNCGKCHANPGDKVFGELSSSGVTQYINLGSPVGTKIHNGTLFYTAGSYQCKACHTINTGGTAKGQHTGVTVKVVCATCHGTEYTQITNVTDAHANFASNASAGVSGTYACIGCHTAVTVAGSPSYKYGPAIAGVDGLTIGSGTGP